MGKYDKVIPSLEKVATIAGDSSFREKVEELKKELSALSSSQLAEAYSALRKEKAALEDQVSELNVRIAAAEETMWGAFEDDGIASIKLKSGGGVRVQPEPKATIVDRDALRAWFIEQGLERMLNPAWQSLNSMAKERLLAGDDMPPGVEVKVFNKTVYSKK